MFESFMEKLTGTNRQASVNPDCSEFEVNNWIISEFIVKKVVPKVGIRPFPLCELSLMVSAVCRFRPTHIFEWGTHIGKSARVFYETCRYFGIKTEIHSTDLPDDVFHNEHPGYNRGKLVRNCKNVFLHQGDGLETSLEIIKSQKLTGPLFFVDGDHSLESVKKELGEIIRHAPDARILLHDTFFQSKESGYNIGPHMAVKKVLNSTPNNFRTIEINTGLPGMTLLYP